MTTLLTLLLVCAPYLPGGPSSPPAPPAPGDERSFEVQFRGGDVLLAGTLTLPPGDGPHPAMAITHGSEPGRRGGYGLYTRLFLEQGLAVLCYDKRGVGDSEGDYVESPDLRQPCADLLGAVGFLRSHPDIDGERIGVFGASQGGWVAPMAAALSDHIAFVCVQSAPGVSPLEQNLFDKGNQLLAAGVSPEDVARATAYRRAYWTYLISGEGLEEARRLRRDIEDRPWFTVERFPFPFGTREQCLRHPRLLNWALHTAYEPRLTLERLRVPLLAVFGGDDSIVPVEASVAAFRAAYALSGQEGLAIEVIEGGDHGVRVPASDGRRRVSPAYLDRMGEWVAERAFGDD